MKFASMPNLSQCKQRFQPFNSNPQATSVPCWDARSFGRSSISCLYSSTMLPFQSSFELSPHPSEPVRDGFLCR